MMRYVDAGVKHFILPKPVVMNQEQLTNLASKISANQIKAAVASQWYYSDSEAVLKSLSWHNTALKIGSKCSFTPCKLRFLADFCLVLRSPE
jgi:hypothetical protein